jgi:hypothetical protein
LPGHRRIAHPSDRNAATRAGQGDLPKSLILAYAGRCAPPEFLIIGRRFPARAFLKNLIVSDFQGLQPRPNPRPALMFRIPEQGRGGKKHFPQIPHTCPCTGRRPYELANHHSDINRRNNGIGFPQIPHSWLCSRPSGTSGRPASRGFSTPRQQGRALGSPQILHTCLSRRPGSRHDATPQIPHSWTIIYFRIKRRLVAPFPKSLIITPQISHFTPQILHNCAESFPKFLIGVPKSFIITLLTL